MIGLLVLIHLNADKDLVRYVALIAHLTQMGELSYEEVRALAQSRTATIWWRREMSPDILAPALTQCIGPTLVRGEVTTVISLFCL